MDTSGPPTWSNPEPQIPPPPFAPADPPPGSPATPPKRSRAMIGVILLAVGVGILAGVAVTLILSSSKNSSTEVPGTDGGAETSSHALTGTFTYPGACSETLEIIVDDSSGAQLDAAKVDQKTTKGDCAGTFSTQLPPRDAYKLSLKLTSKQGRTFTLPGRTFTQAALADQSYKLNLTLDDFGASNAQAEVQSDIQKAIVAANKYYDKKKTFEGLTPAVMHGLEPTLTFNDDHRAVQGQVTLRLATDQWVLFVERRSDGTPIAIGDSPTRKLQCYGEIDARSVKACIAWQPAGGGSGVPGGQPGDQPVQVFSTAG